MKFFAVLLALMGLEGLAFYAIFAANWQGSRKTREAIIIVTTLNLVLALSVAYLLFRKSI